MSQTISQPNAGMPPGPASPALPALPFGLESTALRFGIVPAVGERLLVEVRGSAEMAATVRWIDREQDIDGVFRARDADGRITRSPRFTIRGRATLRLGERRLAVDLLDVSPGGLEVATAAALRRGDPGSIVLPGSDEPTFGTICWTRDARAGFRFVRPLPLAALSRVLAEA